MNALPHFAPAWSTKRAPPNRMVRGLLRRRQDERNPWTRTAWPVLPLAACIRIHGKEAAA
jgi:hypothetical protein